MNYEIAMYIVSNIFITYIISRFLKTLLSGLKVRSQTAFIFFSIYFLIISWVYLAFHNDALNFISSTAAIFLLSAFLYHGDWRKKIFVPILVLAVCISTESITWIMLAKIVKTSHIADVGSFIFLFLLFIIEIIIERFLFRHRREHAKIIPFQQAILLITIPAGSIFISIALMETLETFRTIEGIAISILVFFNILIFYLYEKILTFYEEKIKNNILEEQINAYHQQFELMQQTQEKMRSLRHDMRNHIKLLNNYISSGNFEQAKVFLQQVSENVLPGSASVDTGNPDIDSILNYMINEAKSQDIKVSTKMSIPEQINIPAFDINVILSNLLTNAIEASEKVADKLISISLKASKGILFINIQNHYNGITKDKKGAFQLPATTKKDHKLHGIGLTNVRQIVEKYNGEMDIAHDGSLFTVSLFLYLK